MLIKHNFIKLKLGNHSQAHKILRKLFNLLQYYIQLNERKVLKFITQFILRIFEHHMDLIVHLMNFYCINQMLMKQVRKKYCFFYYLLLIKLVFVKYFEEVELLLPGIVAGWLWV